MEWQCSAVEYIPRKMIVRHWSGQVFYVTPHQLMGDDQYLMLIGRWLRKQNASQLQRQFLLATVQWDQTKQFEFWKYALPKCRLWTLANDVYTFYLKTLWGLKKLCGWTSRLDPMRLVSDVPNWSKIQCKVRHPTCYGVLAQLLESHFGGADIQMRCSHSLYCGVLFSV